MKEVALTATAKSALLHLPGAQARAQELPPASGAYSSSRSGVQQLHMALGILYQAFVWGFEKTDS